MPRCKTRRKRRHDAHRDTWLWWLGLLALTSRGSGQAKPRPASSSSSPFDAGGGSSDFGETPYDAGGGSSDFGGSSWQGRALPTVLSQDELRELAAAVGFPDPHLASAIAMAESGGRTDNANVNAREASIGLWQINTRAHPDVDAVALLDPHYNAAQAIRISQGGTNWTPWGAFTDGSYKRYL